MISSISINGNKVSPGIVTIEADPSSDMSITASDNIVDFSASRYVMDSTGEILLPDKCPYVTSIAGGTPDDWGYIWVLGGLSTQIDERDDGFTFCDMSQTVDYPRIYRSVYAMLRQIRLWVDAHKDSLILPKSAAEAQWDNMKEGGDGWDISDSDLPMFKESRHRQDIPAIGDAINLLNEYLGVVALWNHIVNEPKVVSDVRLHPADQSGIYAGINIILPTDHDENSDIEIDISISRSGQTGDNLYTWVRMPVARIIPDINDDSSDSLVSSAINCSLNGVDRVDSDPPSALDNGVNFLTPGTGDDMINVNISTTIPKDTANTVHTIQCVIEAIPFFKCPREDGSTENTYAESKKGDHVYERGESSWTINVTINKNKEELYKESIVKKTMYANVCPDQIGSSSISDAS